MGPTPISLPQLPRQTTPPPRNRWQLPNLGVGIGLRGPHIQPLLQGAHAVDWLEIISDNALIHQGWLRNRLLELRERYPLVLHGIGLNLGSTAPLDLNYLRQLKNLADELHVPWVSDHLSWSGTDCGDGHGLHTYDLLPLPYTPAMLDWLVSRAQQVQDVLERPLMVENPSSYMAFASSTLPEWTLLGELCERADCGLLLDVNNIYVSSQNHGFHPQTYLDAMPWDRVTQVHVAGHTAVRRRGRVTHLLDTHIGAANVEVWQLYRQVMARTGGRSTLYEWDDALGPLDDLVAVARQSIDLTSDLPLTPTSTVWPLPAPWTRQTCEPALTEPPEEIRRIQTWLCRKIVGARPVRLRGALEAIPLYLQTKGPLTPAARVAVHRQMYLTRTAQAVRADFPITFKHLGSRAPQLLRRFQRQFAPTSPTLEGYSLGWPTWLREQLPKKDQWLLDVATIEKLQIDLAMRPTPPPWTPPSPQLLAGDPSAIGLIVSQHQQIVEIHPRAWAALKHSSRVGQHRVIVQVWRHGDLVRTERIDPLQASFFQAVSAGQDLGAALAGLPTTFAQDRRIQKQLANWLTRWASQGLLLAVRPSDHDVQPECR